MKQQRHKIDQRLAEISELVSELEAETAMLTSVRSSLQLSEHLVLASDTFSPRTAPKFEILARVADYLSEPDQYIFGGASTKAIYTAVLDRLTTHHQGPGRYVAFQDGPPNYNTFRSYLARFKAEKRIFYDGATKRWRLTEHKPELPKTHGERDEMRERYAD